MRNSCIAFHTNYYFIDGSKLPAISWACSCTESVGGNIVWWTCVTVVWRSGCSDGFSSRSRRGSGVVCSSWCRGSSSAKVSLESQRTVWFFWPCQHAPWLPGHNWLDDTLNLYVEYPSHTDTHTLLFYVLNCRWSIRPFFSDILRDFAMATNLVAKMGQNYLPTCTYRSAILKRNEISQPQ